MANLYTIIHFVLSVKIGKMHSKLPIGKKGPFIQEPHEIDEHQYCDS